MKENRLRAPFQTEEVENNWAISYGDMITLLLGFFVLFFNIRTDVVNIKLLKKDLDEYFAAESNASRTPSSAQTPSGQETVPVITSNIANKLQIKSNIEGERILVEFPGISFFNSGSRDLTKSGQEALAKFAKALDGHLGLFRLVVRGYTDQKPVSGRSGYHDNLELSAFRSISAIRYLSQQGVHLEKMRIAGYGESSWSRKEKELAQEASQRKVVIVIEPLDHTERLPASTEGSARMGEESIENSGAAIQGLNEKTNELSLQEVLYQVNNKIESLQWYQQFVDYLIRLELRRQGNSPKKVETIMKEHQKRNKP